LPAPSPASFFASGVSSGVTARWRSKSTAPCQANISNEANIAYECNVAYQMREDNWEATQRARKEAAADVELMKFGKPSTLNPQPQTPNPEPKGGRRLT